MSPADAAVVRVAVAPGRGRPSHRSELVTQWRCGESLEVVEESEEGDEGWLRVTGPDGYRSWVDGGCLLRPDAAGAARWREDADRVSRGTGLRPAGAGPVPRFLPWGARVAAAGGGDGEGGVRLPDGSEAEPVDPERVVAAEECVLRFPPRADALLATAEEWVGVPYLWGGRTRHGADCSGYVQAVLALHGRELPRDGGLQMRADPAAWTAEDGGGTDLPGVARDVLRPGDLLFFGDDEGVTHVALSAGDTEILHAAAGRGQAVRDDLAAGDPLMERLRERLLAVTRPLARAG